MIVIRINIRAKFKIRHEMHTCAQRKETCNRSRGLNAYTVGSDSDTKANMVENS